MNSLEWLNSPGAVDGLTIIEEIGELVVMNGGLSWKGFGTHQKGGPLGRYGLSLEEAIRLVYLSGALDGFFKAEDGANKAAVVQAIKDQTKKIADKAAEPKIVAADGTPIGATNQER